jgi:hypothetical protein
MTNSNGAFSASLTVLPNTAKDKNNILFEVPGGPEKRQSQIEIDTIRP